MPLNETTTQFLARMILATREQQQISSADARKLADLSQFGSRPATTMPEERRSGTRLVQPPVTSPRDLVTD
jgi:hypothetical protein